jgi:hypothetical protein
MVKKENEGDVSELCPKCGQGMIKLSDGIYNCECQAEKSFNEEDPCLDLGYDIRGFV